MFGNDGTDLFDLQSGKVAGQDVVRDHDGASGEWLEVFSFPHELFHHPTTDVLHVEDPVTEVGVLDARERFPVAGEHISQRLESAGSGANFFLELVSHCSLSHIFASKVYPVPAELDATAYDVCGASANHLSRSLVYALA